MDAAVLVSLGEPLEVSDCKILHDWPFKYVFIFSLPNLNPILTEAGFITGEIDVSAQAD